LAIELREHILAECNPCEAVIEKAPYRKITEPICFSKALIHPGSRRPEVGIANFFLAIRNGSDPVETGLVDTLPPNFFISDDVFVDRIEKVQRESNNTVDGIVGTDTWGALVKPGMPYPPLMIRVLSAIGHVETGHKQEGFGVVIGEIGDGAGNNFGPMQINDRGSLDSVLKLAGQDELSSRYSKYRGTNKEKQFRSSVASFVGSYEGIDAQLQYFKDKYYRLDLVDGVFNSLGLKPSEFPAQYEKAIHLVTDIMVQGGNFYGSYRFPYVDKMKKYWSTEGVGRHVSLDELNDVILKVSKQSTFKEVNMGLVVLVLSKLNSAHISDATKLSYALVAIALLRSYCSREKYADRVAIRKMAIAKGQGTIHGEHLDFEEDFGIGVL